MATQSTAPPNPTDEKPQTTASELVKPRIEDGQDAKAAAAKEDSTTSVFVNSEPMREEQVQNAVKFLSHPKVRGSPVIYRRSFLEKKGLTKEEIDEAFRRVPDPPPTTTSAPPASTNQDGQLKSSSNIQPQAPTQILQPAAAAPAGAISKAGTLTQYRFHWSHALLAIGFLAVSGAGTAVLVKNTFVPRLKSWIRKVVSEEENDIVEKTNSKPSFAEEAAAAAKAAAAAATDVAKASQEMLNTRNEERRYIEKFMNVLDVQVQEMKSMSNAIRKLEGQNNASGRIPIVEQEDRRGSVTNIKQSYVNGKADLDSHSVRSSSPPASVESSLPPGPPHPKSYMEIMAMVQRGEKPPNIKEINDLPPNPNQQLSNPRITPRTKPWEVGQAPNSSSLFLQSQSSSEGLNSKVQDNGLNSQLDINSSVPWWQQKNGKITEIETEEFKTGSDGATERPAQRTWVPPQPPPVAMAEAAAAIRQPKSLIRKEQTADDQVTVRSTDGIDELQRITKISESGGVVENNGSSSGMNSSEIQEEQDYSIEGK